MASSLDLFGQWRGSKVTGVEEQMWFCGNWTIVIQARGFIVLRHRDNDVGATEAARDSLTMENILCNQFKWWARRNRQGDIMTSWYKSMCNAAGISFKEWSKTLSGMQDVWHQDAASCSFKEPGLQFQELELRPVRHFGDQDAHAARLPSPCPVCIPQEDDEGERTGEPGVACISRP